jgi:threonine dehydrogenase-like Zn-dependent dehydrogenase
MYEGRTAAEPGIVFGHENMGIVTEVGDAVSTLEEGDRVVAPFNVACGFCQNCEDGYTGFCTNVNPGFAGGAYGYVAMGPYKGGQAEKLRIPYADFNALKLPEGDEHEDAFALLADIFPTGWHGTELANLEPGDSVAIFGAGPVGLMAAFSAKIKGASEIYAIDRVPSRLELAEDHCDATAINFDHGDPVEQVIEEHGGEVDKGVDAVGYQALDPEDVSEDDDYAYQPAKENPAVVLNQLIQVVRPTGELGIPGLYVPSDPNAPDEMAAQGRLGIDFGKLFEKGQKLGTGQCNVKAYNRQLRDLIIEGRADPSWVVSHRVDLEQAPEMYERFDEREEGDEAVTKVMLEP